MKPYRENEAIHTTQDITTHCSPTAGCYSHSHLVSQLPQRVLYYTLTHTQEVPSTLGSQGYQTM